MRAYAFAIPMVGLLLLSGCTHVQPRTDTPPEPATSDRTSVDWASYPSDAQRLIDESEAAGDCSALQDAFNVADQAGFLDQMKYIDEALTLADCYK